MKCLPPLDLASPMTPKQIAPLLGRSTRTIQRLCARGRVRTVPVGRPYLIPSAEVDRLLAHARTTPTP